MNEQPRDWPNDKRASERLFNAMSVVLHDTDAVVLLYSAVIECRMDSE